MRVATSACLRGGVRAILGEFPELRLEEGARHPKVRNPKTRDFITLPVSPSGGRWRANLRAQLRRLAKTGRGLIAAKKGGRRA